MRVSVDKICKFDFKFERKKLRRSIFEMIFGVAQVKFRVKYFFFLLRASARNETSLRGDKEEMSRARAHTYSM